MPLCYSVASLESLVTRESSYGIIPVKKELNDWQVLLVQLHAGHWSFPKGHPEPGETPKQTAERELFEETGLQPVLFLSDSEITEEYVFTHHGRLIFKKVTYFIAEVSGEIRPQVEEINACQWFSLKDAYAKLSFKEAKKVLQATVDLLTG